MKRYFILLVAFTTLFACRKDEEFDGPDLYDIYGEFSVVSTLMPSQSNIDFSTGATMHFTCELSKISTWKLSITGQTSGAEKIIEGIGKVLDESNATWNGSTTNLPMFRTETCEVMLTFEGESDTLYTTVSVDQPKTNSGFIVADFESGWNGGWTTFIQSGANMDFSIKSDGTAPELGNYYNMQGIVNWDWLIGLVQFNAAAYGENTLPLSSNPSNLYFNALVYGEAGLPNTLVLFRFDEDENEDGTFDANNEDQFSYEINVDWEGWKLVSIKYDELNGGGNGGGVFNPDKLNKVEVLHLANPSSGFAKSGLDYLIFTQNGPLEP